MAAAPPPRPSGETPPREAIGPVAVLGPPVDLGDGTLVVHGRRGDVRLSRDRSRWWNGRAWQRVDDSTPWNAHLDAEGEAWWDGVEWRPRRASTPIWARRPVLAALAGSWLLWVILLAAGALPAIVGVALIVLVSGPGIVLTLTSNLLRGGEKGLYLLSAVGLGILWVRGRMTGRTEAGAADGSAHLVM